VQIRLEIGGEIIDGRRDSGQIVASNGLHYRWIASVNRIYAGSTRRLDT
jgi:hypothetical protein